MIGCIDVHYQGDIATAALVLFDDWTSGSAIQQLTTTVACPGPYIPGEFYKRELPCILAVLQLAAPNKPETLIIDGYVWLSADQAPKPGLGAHLYHALNQNATIIGAAKTEFKQANATPILRGTSKTPLYVTAAGISSTEAASHIKSMHGPHRLPTMIKLADHLARTGVKSP